MTFTEIKNYLLSITGQYNIEVLDIDDNIINQIVNRALSTYSQYKPLITYKKINIPNSPYKISTIENYTIIDIDSLYLANPTKFFNAPKLDYVKYNKTSKELYTVLTGSYWARVWLVRKLDDITNDDYEFFDLVQAYFLIAIGTNRSNFVINDLPFTTNADDLKSAGKELLDNTIENLKNTDQYWWEAIN